jgi:hypothetical protein
MSRQQGLNSIAPTLRYRAVVSRNSGAFEILQDARQTFLLSHRSKEDQDGYATGLCFALQRLVMKEVSPFIVDEDGNNLMHAGLLTLAQRVIADQSRFSSDVLWISFSI